MHSAPGAGRLTFDACLGAGFATVPDSSVIAFVAPVAPASSARMAAANWGAAIYLRHGATAVAAGPASQVLSISGWPRPRADRVPRAATLKATIAPLSRALR
ncbi:hypothetical protein [Gulosibacter sediminis]|uniref:hypothetical protein n=1 Tax=Gulosibacter sediminis TaxID=1729695 RepID=UPI0024A7AB66|nr:hypothetical protein [Gulosibacter sediminis]